MGLIKFTEAALLAHTPAPMSTYYPLSFLDLQIEIYYFYVGIFLLNHRLT